MGVEEQEWIVCMFLLLLVLEYWTLDLLLDISVNFAQKSKHVAKIYLCVCSSWCLGEYERVSGCDHDYGGSTWGLRIGGYGYGNSYDPDRCGSLAW